MKKILLCKPGLDGHDVGVKVLGHALTEAGYKVKYTGLRKSIPEIIAIAQREKPDIIGLSILSGTHLELCRRMTAEMSRNQLNIPWIVGGNIPDEDVQAIITCGAAAAFPTGTTIEEVIEYLRRTL